MKYYGYHNEITNDSIKKVMRYFTGILLPLFRSKIVFYICGGSILSYLKQTPINDIDLFFPNEKNLILAKEKLIKMGFECRFENEIVCNLHKGKIKAQLCKIKYGSLEEILSTFDFTVCCVAINRNMLICHNDFWKDFHNNKLNFNNLDKPRNSLIRIPKYIRKGFNIGYRSLHLLANAIQAEKPQAKPITLFFADGLERESDQEINDFDSTVETKESNQYKHKYENVKEKY